MYDLFYVLHVNGLFLIFLGYEQRMKPVEYLPYTFVQVFFLF